MAQKPKGIGLIGLSAKGSWATASHLPYLTSTTHFGITSLQNSSKEAADAAAKQYSLPSVSTHSDPQSLANDPAVDIVAVSVNVPQHYSLVKPALEGGKDVFCEWPLARNLAEAEELTALAKEKGVRTLVGLQARQNPSIIKAREYVQRGKLGKILGTTMYGHGLIFGETTHDGFLYGLPVEAGANLVTIPFGHAVDALCFVLGEIAELSATLANHRLEMPIVDQEGNSKGTAKKTAHDYVSVTGTLVNGGVVDATYAGGTSRTGREFYWEINGTEGSLVLQGNRGHIQMYQPSIRFVGREKAGRVQKYDSGTDDADTGPQLEEMEVEKAGDFSFSVGRAWDAWAGKGLEKGHSVTTFEDAVVRHRLIEAVYRSAEKGSRERYL